MADNLPAVVAPSLAGQLAAFATSGDDPFSKAGSEMGSGAFTRFVKFSGNTGEYTYGKNDESDIDHGTKVAINPLTFARGGICWKNGEVAAEQMTPVVQGEPPLLASLPDHGPYAKKEDGWKAQSSFFFCDTEGNGYEFKTSSKSGMRAVGNLLKDYGKLFRNYPGKVPLITLDADKFSPKDKSFGDKYAPVFKIVDWVDAAYAVAEAQAEDGAEDPSNYATDPSLAPAAVQTTVVVPPAQAAAPVAVVTPVTPTPPAPAPAPVEPPPVAPTAAAAPPATPPTANRAKRRF